MQPLTTNELIDYIGTHQRGTIDGEVIVALKKLQKANARAGAAESILRRITKLVFPHYEDVDIKKSTHFWTLAIHVGRKLRMLDEANAKAEAAEKKAVDLKQELTNAQRSAINQIESYVIATDGLKHQRANLNAQIEQLQEQLNKAKAEQPMMSYAEAKKAVELFEAEYIGQSQRELWIWAVSSTRTTTRGS